MSELDRRYSFDRGSFFLFFSLFSSLAFDRSFFTRLDSDPFPLSIIYSYISVYFACNSFEIGKKLKLVFVECVLDQFGEN